MNINIDYSQLLDDNVNKMLLNMKTGNDKADITTERLIKFANKYGFFGTKAMTFTMDLCKTLAELDEVIKNED